VVFGLVCRAFEDKRRWLEILQVTVMVKTSMTVVICRLSGEPLNYRLIDVNVC